MSEPAQAADRSPHEERSASAAGSASSAPERSAPERSAPEPSAPERSAPEPSGASEPPSPRRRRRRHIRGPIWLICILLFLGCVFVLIDKTATAVAQDKVATTLTDQRPFTGRPTVVIHGFPFLTQAVRGKYRDIEVSGVGTPVARLGTAQIDARLQGVHIPLSSVGTSVGSVPVDHVDVTMSVPASRLGPALGIAGLRLSPSGSNVRMVAPVKVAGRATITANVVAQLSVRARALTATVRSVRLGSGTRTTSAPASVVSAVKKKLALRLPVSDLGLDVRAARAQVVSGQLVLTGAADNVVLH